MRAADFSHFSVDLWCERYNVCKDFWYRCLITLYVYKHWKRHTILLSENNFIRYNVVGSQGSTEMHGSWRDHVKFIDTPTIFFHICFNKKKPRHTTIIDVKNTSHFHILEHFTIQLWFQPYFGFPNSLIYGYLLL